MASIKRWSLGWGSTVRMYVPFRCLLSVALSFTGSWKSGTVEKPYVCLPVLQVSTRKMERIGDSKTAAIIPAKTEPTTILGVHLTCPTFCH